MKNKNILPKKICFFCDEPITEMLMINLCRPLGFELHKMEDLDHFFQQWHSGVTQLYWLNLIHTADFATRYPDNQKMELAPLMLSTDWRQDSAQKSFHLWADDFVPQPLTPEIFNEVQAFWLYSTPLFFQPALIQLARTSSPELVEKILHSFNDSLQTAIQQIYTQMNLRNLIGTAKACHSIKASAKLVGAQALYNACLWVELKNRNESPLTEKFKLQIRGILEDTKNQYLALANHSISDILKPVPSF